MTRTMTAAQMTWNLKRGYAWEETPDQDWRMPLWTRDGGWVWDVTSQRYELAIV